MRATSSGARRIDDEMAFVRDRMRDTHDVWHAATGYKGDVLGELGLLAFIVAQKWNTGIALIVFAAIPKGMRRTPILGVVRDGYRRGRSAEWLPSQDWGVAARAPSRGSARSALPGLTARLQADPELRACAPAASWVEACGWSGDDLAQPV